MLRARLTVVFVSLVGCAGPTTVDDSRVAEASARLLSPFQAPRAIVADRLEIEYSANFDSEIARPAISPGVQELSVHRTSTATEYRYRNVRGGTQLPLKFMIGNSTFVVLQHAVLRIPEGRADLRLTALAVGRVVVAEAGTSREGSELTIESGDIRLR
jgi:hypothetical protein